MKTANPQRDARMEKRKRHSVGGFVLEIAVGCMFIAVGLGVLIALLSSVIRAGWSKETIAVIVPILLFVVCPVVFGCIPLVMAFKRIRYAHREKRAEQFGEEVTAKLLDWKTVRTRPLRPTIYLISTNFDICDPAAQSGLRSTAISFP